MSADDLTHDAVVSPTDLAALSADDELLRVAARVDPRTALSDDPLLRVLLAWRRAVDAAPFPPLIGVDTARRLVRRREAAPDPRVRSIVGAREWLLLNAKDEAVAEHFGPPAEECGPPGRGRPEVGERIDVRLGETLLADVQAYADRCDLTRAAAIRDLIAAGLHVGDGATLSRIP